LKTINALARAHGVHPHQVSAWKRQLLEAGRTLFSRAGAPHHRAPPEREVELDEHIGRLKMDLEWLKKHAARFGGGQTREARGAHAAQQPPPALGAGRVAPLAMR